MDDNRFDDLIKKKVAAYEPPGFDPAALGALHHQLGSIRVAPWYSRYQTEMLATGLLLSGLFIAWLLWYNGDREGDNAALRARLRQQQQELAYVQKKLEAGTAPPDTVYVYRAMEPPPAFLLERVAYLERMVKKFQSIGIEESPGAKQPFGTFSATDDAPANYHLSQDRVMPRLDAGETMAAEPLESREASGPLFSVKIFRSLEKHYRKGVGIRLGPAADASTGMYNTGRGSIDFGAGVMADFILSPSLSVETGGKFYHRFYEVEKPAAGSMPFTNPALEPVVLADIDSWLIEIPVNLKYRHPVSPKLHFLAGMGYAAQLYTRQRFEYDYNLEGNSSAHINEGHDFSNGKLYPGSVNLSLALSKRLRNNHIFEPGLYYQFGLGETGAEKARADFFGVRGVYWFVLK